MDSVRRLAYLRALGIDSYVPRETLTGAHVLPVVNQSPAQSVAVSEARESQLRHDNVAVSTQTAPGHNAVNRRRKKVAAEAGSVTEQSETQLPETRDSEAASAELSERPVTASVPDDAQVTGELQTSTDRLCEPAGEFRFSCGFYAVGRELAVICEVPYLGHDQDQPRRDALLAAILRALNLSDPQLPKAERFHWPLTAEEDAADSRIHEACQTLDGFLKKRLQQSPFRVLLVFAVQLQALLDKSGIAGKLEERNIRVIHSHSLDAMLKIPALKKAVWQDIRGLPGFLTSSDQDEEQQ